MKNNLFKYLSLWGVFILYFIFYRTVFILYNGSTFANTTIDTLLLSYLYGLKLDLSFSGYMMLVPSLILAASPIIGSKGSSHLLIGSITLILTAVSVIEIIDLEVYSYWGEKFDAMHLKYLDDPKQITNSISFKTLIFPLLFSLFLFYSHFKISTWVVGRFSFHLKNRYYWQKPLLFFTLIALSLIPIRGGFSIIPFRLGIPINVGAVYFSSDNMAVNHAAVNTPWNFVYSIKKFSKIDSHYDLMPDHIASELFNKINGTPTKGTPYPSLLNISQPNILLIVLESFTAKGVEVLGGAKAVTPHLNRLSKEGVLFSQFYASGHRSNRGIGSLFSSYPGLPYNAIIEHPFKTEKLPHLIKLIKEQDYKTAFYYGGEIDFANFRAYFNQGKADKIVSKLDFDFSSNNTKWGIHDDVVFDTLFNDLNKEAMPFFYTLFTLSSHEPFDIPVEPIFGSNNNENSFKSAMHYTDACLGKFIEEAKKTTWWDQTLIVVTADHGTTQINNTSNGQKETFHIPLLWLGGALAVTDTVISTISCQLDLAPTLLAQLNINHPEYVYGRNMLSTHYKPRAYYSYGDGFGLVSDSISQVYNGEIDAYVHQQPSDSLPDYGRAIYQFISNDFLSLSVDSNLQVLDNKIYKMRRFKHAVERMKKTSSSQ
jgi:phosphoglycerol transferase MdoB-like AlkP superfamily enzyme|tara:strand:- start:833 stop:2791 length:1959 start_codon:yes stop_codon:yes gene_type:complete